MGARLLVSVGLAAVALAGSVTGCSSTRPGARDPDLAGRLLEPAESLPAAAVDLWVEERAVVRGARGEDLLRVRFSFVSYDGYVGEEDRHRSTGTIFFPVDGEGRARPARRGEVALTEFPPGASASGLAVQPEYGERPAVELGLPAALIDLRGPVVRSLREFANPSAAGEETFRSEEQFAYSMLRSFQRSGDETLLWEHRVAGAWLRAMRAVDDIVASETGVSGNRFFLVGEGYGSLGAAHAAACDPRVQGFVLCGWPLDWMDYHFTRWRRWERRARYFPLADLQPIPYADSQEVLSFLSSSPGKPDPACPSCLGTGQQWRAGFDYAGLRREGWLPRARAFVLVGDSDPRFPLDLETRASVPAGAMEAALPRVEPGAPLPRPADGAFGPYSSRWLELPFRDLRYLRGADSELANAQAVEAVLAWMQHLAGYRDVPVMRIFEAVEGGDVRLDVVVREGNAPVTRVEIWLTEIEDRHDSDFKWSTHLAAPEPVRWRRIDAVFAGNDEPFVGRWRAYLPFDVTRNRAYYILVWDRVGDLESAHSLPARTFWSLGDPAAR